MAELVKMFRSEPAREGGPVTADVHPDNVAECLKAGWQVCEQIEQPEPTLDLSLQPEKPKRQKKAK